MLEIRHAFAHGAPAAPARRAAEAVLRLWRMPERIDDVLLVVTELVQNVSQHTSDGGELRLELRDGAILIEVTDASTAMPRVGRQDLRTVGGRGLFLIAAVARRWGTRRTSWSGHPGKVVWVELPGAPH
jgi:anti-sigma regulatory factor (Ser/Thr protein kinase)